MSIRPHLERYLRASLLHPGSTTALSVFTYALDGVTSAARSIIDQAIAHPWIFGIVAALIIGGILFLIVPALVGFGPTGPIASTIAAAWQSWIGNVVEGSLFSILQKFAMKGVFDTIGQAMATLGVAGVAVGLANSDLGKAEMMVRAADFAAGSGSAEERMDSAADFAAMFGFEGGTYGGLEKAQLVARAADFAAVYGFARI